MEDTTNNPIDDKTRVISSTQPSAKPQSGSQSVQGAIPVNSAPKNQQSPVDEKTMVISSINSPAKPQPSPQPIQGARPVNAPPQNQQNPIKTVTSQPPVTSYFKDKDGKTSAKRTIIASAIGGSLLVGILALTGFAKKDENKIPHPIPKDTPPSSPQTNHSSDANETIKEGSVVGINTGLDVFTKLNDDKSLDDAREIARAELGSNALFIHNGELHPTMNNEEWNSQTPEQTLDFINKINVTTPSNEEAVTIPVEVNGETVNVVLDPLHKTDMFQMGNDDSGHVFCIPNGREAVELNNVIVGEDGNYLRVDPNNGEVEHFKIEEIFKQIDDTGKVSVDVIIPGQDNPIIIENNNLINNPPIINEPLQIQKTDTELLHEKELQIAKDAGIDDITKIKTHLNDDGSYDIKIKGDDGEKIKTHITLDDLHQVQHQQNIVTQDDSNIVNPEIVTPQQIHEVTPIAVINQETSNIVSTVEPEIVTPQPINEVTPTNYVNHEIPNIVNIVEPEVVAPQQIHEVIPIANVSPEIQNVFNTVEPEIVTPTLPHEVTTNVIDSPQPVVQEFDYNSVVTDGGNHHITDNNDPLDHSEPGYESGRNDNFDNNSFNNDDFDLTQQ